MALRSRLFCLGALLAIGCGGSPDSVEGGHSGGASGGAPSGSGGALISVPGTGGQPVGPSPCADTECGARERCEVTPGTGEPQCVPQTCKSLKCGEDTTCDPGDGSGAYCRSIKCRSDLDCAAAEYCDATTHLCQGTACAAGAASCAADVVSVCNSNGSASTEFFACGSSAAGFTSGCVEGASGQDYGCTCRDDWDCPAYTRCEATALDLTFDGSRVGLCQGTGEAPQCTLPPQAFSGANTKIEIQWGSAELGVGNGATKYPTAADPATPYPVHIQVVMTPLVANLDDDNGDGYVDERDIPEIVFLAMDDSNYKTDGVLRAIHGGGEQKGRDLFATCGANERWTALDGQLAGDGTCTDSEATLDPTAGLAVGDLDYDGIPEIVGVDESNYVLVFDNRGKQLLRSSVAAQVQGDNPYPTLANLDGQGHAEIVVGRSVFSLTTTAGVLSERAVFHGNAQFGYNSSQGPVACVADVDGDGRQEIIAGASVYALPDAGGETDQATCSGSDWCDNKLTLLRKARAGGVDLPDGFCAVADLLGADRAAAPSPDNPLDGAPEVALIASGHLYLFDPATGLTHRTIELDGDGNAGNNEGGGAPNVDDFDGDGFPEVGTATERSYRVVDLQSPSVECPAWTQMLSPDGPNPNPTRLSPATSCATHADCGDGLACNTVTHQCVCQHNGWQSATEDDSSRVTGSSVFDFNGDGAAEVVYNDECKFRVYAGADGAPYIQNWSESRTRIEYPIVADVDRDGNSEIVFATTTESKFCSKKDTVDPASGKKVSELTNAGIEVWGDASDLWVPARRIWNQHAYHVTNVTESGQIPRHEPNSWASFAGRSYNTYRSNPRNYGVAPDLIVRNLQYTSPDAACGALGSTLDIVVQVANEGDLLVGGEVTVALLGDWGAGFEPLRDAAGDPLLLPLGTSLDPNRDLRLTLRDYTPARNGQNSLPLALRAVVDAASLETECREDNNALETAVTTGAPLADLRVRITSAGGCPAQLALEVENVGAADALAPVVALYTGDPAQGGVERARVDVPGTLAPGQKQTVTAAVELPQGRSVNVHAVVDPEDRVAECNDGNNEDAVGPLMCGVITR